ncbi:hypothetical protein D3C86_2154570 [compost metagenome]
MEIGEENEEWDNLEPGKVLSIKDNKIEIKTGDSAVWLIKHEFIDLPEVGSYIL